MMTDASGSAFDVDGKLVQSDNSLLASFAGEGTKAWEIVTDELSSGELEMILEKCLPRDRGVQKIADRYERPGSSMLKVFEPTSSVARPLILPTEAFRFTKRMPISLDHPVRLERRKP